MRSFYDALTVVLVLAAPICLLHSWYFYFARMLEERANWRVRMTLLSLILLSVAAFAWPAILILKPPADWRVGLGSLIRFDG
jgi:hypothetical protein